MLRVRVLVCVLQLSSVVDPDGRVRDGGPFLWHGYPKPKGKSQEVPIRTWIVSSSSSSSPVGLLPDAAVFRITTAHSDRETVTVTELEEAVEGYKRLVLHTLA